MSSPIDRPIEIRLDRVRHLRPDFNALAAFEEAMGVRIAAVDLARPSAREFRALIWAFLQDCASDDPEKACACPPDPEMEDRATGLRRVGRYLQLGQFAQVMATVNATIAAGAPAEGDAPLGEAETGPAPAARTGRRSGRSAGTTSGSATASSGG